MPRLLNPFTSFAACFALTLGVAALVNPLQAQEVQDDDLPADILVYGATGESELAYAAAGTTYALGGLIMNDTGLFFGADLGFEGVEVDTTGGQAPETSQSLSLNGIIGRSFGDGENSPRFSAGILLGVYDTAVSCPASNLGYDCYANREPETESDLNVGAVGLIDFGGIAVGVRATGLSQQVMVGFSF